MREGFEERKLRLCPGGPICSESVICRLGEPGIFGHFWIRRIRSLC